MFRILFVLGTALIMSVLPLDVQAAPKAAKADTSKKMKATVSSAPAVLAPADLGPDGVRVVTLANGLTVLVKPDDRFPLVTARLLVHAGSAFESRSQAGISHVLEHMVFKGTKKRPAGSSAAEIEAVGGHMNAATSFDSTVYYVDVPDKHWALGLDVIGDMAFGARLASKELASEKPVVLSELERRSDEPGTLLFEDLLARTWKGTSYEWPVIGFRDTVEGISSEDLKAYVKRFYQPQSMVLAVVGRVNPDAVVAEAQRLFGTLKNDRPVPAREPYGLPQGTGATVRVTPGKWNKVYLAVAFPVPGSGSGDEAGIEMLTHVLGGDDTSRLYRRFKYEKKLVDSISVSNVGFERGGMFYLQATLDAKNVEPFWTDLVAELAGLHNATFSEHEIARGRLNIEHGLFLAKETLSGLASKLAYFQFYDGTLQAEERFLHSLAQVDGKEMARLAGTYLRPQNLAVALLTPEGADIPEASLAKTLADLWPSRPGPEIAAATQGGSARILDLPGGSRLVLIPDPTLPYVGLSLAFTGGDALLSAQEQGLAELTASALTRGTANRTANQIEDFLADRASDFSATSGRDTFSFTAKFPTRFAEDLLGLTSEVLTKPAFAPAEVERAKKDQIAGIKRREDQPMGLAFRHMFPFLFATAPYGYYHEGMPETVAAFAPEAMAAFWKRQSSKPFVLALCGAFDPARMTAFAESLSRTLALQGPAVPTPFVAPQWNAERTKILNLADRNQAHLLAVFPTPGEDDPDTAGLNLLRAILAGQSGLLFRDLRDGQSLGYAVTAFVWQAPKSGFMAFYIGTTPDKLAAAREGFKRTVAALDKTPLPEAEVARAKNLLWGEYYHDRQSLLSRGREAATLLIRGYDLTRNVRQIEQSQALTPTDLRDLAARYLKWDEAYQMEVRP